MDPFVAEVRIVGFNFAPRNWALCNGQTIPIQQNTALFSLLGTYFGGNGKTTFGLPNLQGASPIGAGSGPGLTQRNLGDTGGAATVTLQSSQMAQHNHTMSGASGFDIASTNVPTDGTFEPTTAPSVYAAPGNNAQMSPSALSTIGGGGAHNNMMPYLGMNFVIALLGVYPRRP